MASTGNHYTSSSGAVELMRQMSSSVPQEALMLGWDWLYLEPEPEYKPPLHQKRQRSNIQTVPLHHKGIGYVEQFRGIRYPIGGKR